MDAASFSIGKPQFFVLIFLILPPILFTLLHYKKHYSSFELKNSSSSLRTSLFLRLAFRSLSWIFAILALCEISFGSKKALIQKNGSSVTFVFDISYSMLAKDLPQSKTRLDGSKLYASALLSHLSSSVSVVLAKGDGFTAIPETEDFALVENFIQNLSPSLMTSAGSSLGKGIEAAINAIPAHSAKSHCIWVFTDGDETDNRLEKSLEIAQKFGIPVTFVGFGSEKETEILAGDGKTRVKTALRAEKLRHLSEVSSSAPVQLLSARNSKVSFVNSQETGSAWNLLNQIKADSLACEQTTASYEIQKINRHSFFIFLAVLCLILSFVGSEFKINSLKKILSVSVLFFTIFGFVSCSSEKKQILEGTWAWYEGKYNTATAHFLNTTNSTDEIARSYALFDLSATYLSMNEPEASLERLNQLNLDDENLPNVLRTAGFYNIGIIYAQKSEYATAASYFKKAIMADSSNMNAKINLELCERELVQKQTKSAETEMQGVNEEKTASPSQNNEIFTLIRENEGKKWRNMSEGEKKNDGTIDY